MTTFQMIAVAAAALIALSSFWPQIKLALSPVTKVKVAVEHDHPPLELSEIVGCWESLKEACKRTGRIEAADKLDEIFPLFVPKESIASVDRNIQPSGKIV